MIAIARAAVLASSRLLLGFAHRPDTRPAGPSSRNRATSRRTWRVVRPSRCAARHGLSKPSATDWMTLNLSSSRIVMVILSVAAIAASGAEGSTPGKLMPHQSGHLNLAESGHYNLAATVKISIIYLMSNFPRQSTALMSRQAPELIVIHLRIHARRRSTN